MEEKEGRLGRPVHTQILTVKLMGRMKKGIGALQAEEEKDGKRWMMKKSKSWAEEDREKLEESESVCECNSLPLPNPREFTDCRREERGVDGGRQRGESDHSRGGGKEIQRETTVR